MEFLICSLRIVILTLRILHKKKILVDLTGMCFLSALDFSENVLCQNVCRRDTMGFIFFQKYTGGIWKMKKRNMLLLAMLAAAVIGGGISGGVQNVSAAEADRTMTFGIQEYGIGVDPAQEINTAWNCSRYGIGECLFKFNDSMEVVNTLCDDYTVNEEHTEWVFHIREGVKFSDGCDLTPETVKASFERLLEDGKNGSSTPEKFLPAESVITADNAAGTVTIVTPDPVVDLTKNLAYPTMIILDTEHTTDYVSGSIGTGPYAMSEFKEHVGATVVRNEYYWDGEVPYDSIELLYMGDASAKAMAMQAGQLDLTENVTNIADLQKLQEDPNFTVTIASGVRTGLAHMNMSEGRLLSNKELREAVLMALDDESMCGITVGGLYTSGYSVLPSNLDYGYENLVDPTPYDPAAAAAKLDEAGIVDTDGDGVREMPDGTPVVLHYVTYANRCLDTFAEAVQQQLAEIGIGINLEIGDSTRQWDSYQSGDFDLNGSNWITVGTGDPTEYLASWYSKSGADFCGYENPEYDKLYEELSATFDEEARKEIIQQLQQILLDDAVAIVHGYYNSSMISRNETIGGAAIHTADYYWVTTEIYPAE